MEEFYKLFIKAINEEPIFIVRGIVKLMRTLSTFLISVLIYTSIFGEFELITNIPGIFNFFTDGAFVKPVLTYVAVVLLFDVILNFLLQVVFEFTFVWRKIKNINKLEVMMKDTKEVNKEALTRLTGRVIRKCNKKLIRGSTPEMKEYAESINEVSIRRIDITCLIVAQWIVLSILFDLNIFLILGFAAVLILIEYIKRNIELTSRLFEVLYTEPELEG